MTDDDWKAVAALSERIEKDEGWDSLTTMETNYPVDDDTGATLCPFPDCGFRRHDPRAMFRHVHFSDAHGLSYAATFPAFVFAAKESM